MRLYIGLTLAAVALVWCEEQEYHGVGRNYKEELLTDIYENPMQLSVEYSTNTLFFSVTKPLNKTDSTTGYLNLSTGEKGAVQGLFAGIATAVDNKNHTVYLSDITGIHSYNPVTKQIKLVDSDLSKLIIQMFYKDRLYYVDFGGSAYVYENGVSRSLDELHLEDFDFNYIAVDKNDNIWIYNSQGLLYFDKNEKVLKSNGYHGDITAFTVDSEGNLYFSSLDGIYTIKDDHSVQQLFPMKDDNIILGLAIDAERNFIYSDGRRIVKMKIIDDQ